MSVNLDAQFREVESLIDSDISAAEAKFTHLKGQLSGLDTSIQQRFSILEEQLEEKKTPTCPFSHDVIAKDDLIMFNRPYDANWLIRSILTQPNMQNPYSRALLTDAEVTKLCRHFRINEQSFKNLWKNPNPNHRYRLFLSLLEKSKATQFEKLFPTPSQQTDYEDEDVDHHTTPFLGEIGEELRTGAGAFCLALAGLFATCGYNHGSSGEPSGMILSFLVTGFFLRLVYQLQTD